MSENLEMPHWKVGTQWVLKLLQRAFWARIASETWVGPSYLSFEVTEIESDAIHLRAEALMVPDRYDQIWAEARLDASDRRLIGGTLHIGEQSLDLEYDLFGQLLAHHPPGVDMEGTERQEEIFLGPNEPITLTTRTSTTESGVTRTSSLELPYHLRIEDADFTTELVSWR